MGVEVILQPKAITTNQPRSSRLSYAWKLGKGLLLDGLHNAIPSDSDSHAMQSSIASFKLFVTAIKAHYSNSIYNMTAKNS